MKPSSPPPLRCRPGSFSGVAIVLAAFVPCADAFQGSAILGREDGLFARRLHEAGYEDLAQRLCEAVKDPANAAGSTPEERLEIESLELQFELEAARREPDLLARKAAIGRAIEEKRAFIARNPNTSAAQVAQDGLPDDLRLLAETITGILGEKGLDSEEAAAQRKEGLELFEQAQSELSERVKRFQEQSREVGPQADDALQQIELSLFNLGRTRYFESLLYAPDDPRRREALDEAIETFEEFGLEFPDSLNSYVAAIYEGLSHRDDGNAGRALDAFDYAISLRETYLPLPDGRFDVSADAADIISQAVLQKVLLLADQKSHADASAVAADFFETIPEAWAASHARRVALLRAEELLAANQAQEALQVAQELASLAPDTPEGRRASEILSSAAPGALDPAQILRVAQDQVVRGELDRALATVRQALGISRADQADVIASAYELIGVIYVRQGRTLEALVAFDAAVDLAPTAERAPDILYRCANLYLDVAAKEKKPYFRKKGMERMRSLAEQYSAHPLAVKVAIGEGRALESEEKWTEAAELYARIPVGSKVYEEAQYRLGLCTYRAAKARAIVGTIDAKEVDRARSFLARSRSAAEARAAQTLDAAETRELASVAFQSLTLEIEMLLDSQRTEEADALLALAESGSANDPSAIGRIRGLRLQSMLQREEFERAIDLLDSTALATPADPFVAGAAFQLAVGLDGAADRVSETDPARAGTLRRDASRFYAASVRPQLSGKDALNPERLDQVADRLLVLGMYANGLPDAIDTFVDLESVSAASTDAWDSAARIYEFEISQAPSQRRRIQYGRALGLLGQYEQAADTYAAVFDSTPVIQREGEVVRIVPEIAKDRPDLIAGLLEYAVADHRAGVAAGDKNRIQRAAQVIADLVLALKSTTPDTRLFWQLRYAQARSLMDRGLYPAADLLVDDLQRTTNDFDQGRFGYKDKFLATRKELDKKVP